MTRFTLALLTVLVAFPPAKVAAQAAGPGGFLFRYQPEDRRAFEPGYRRHLDWHRAHEDTLNWFGWDVLVGPEPGLFVDGVFGVPFAALDTRVDPSGDQEDAAVNVAAFARPLGREMLALRADLSTATLLEEAEPAAVVEVVWYDAQPGGLAALEAAFGELHAEGAANERYLPYSVYERVAGSETGFVLMIWRHRLATFDEYGRNPRRALDSLLAGDNALRAHARSSRSEVWLHRPDLTYLGSRKGET